MLTLGGSLSAIPCLGQVQALFRTEEHEIIYPVQDWRSKKRLGLSTSCSRFPKKLPVISQKVAQKLLQKSKKVARDNKSCSKVAPKKSKNAASNHENFSKYMLIYL